MKDIDLSQHIIEEISDADYKSAMLDFSPLPEPEILIKFQAEPKRKALEHVLELLAA